MKTGQLAYKKNLKGACATATVHTGEWIKHVRWLLSDSVGLVYFIPDKFVSYVSLPAPLSYRPRKVSFLASIVFFPHTLYGSTLRIYPHIHILPSRFL